jgi:hypothetical protein
MQLCSIGAAVPSARADRYGIGSYTSASTIGSLPDSSSLLLLLLLLLLLPPPPPPPLALRARCCEFFSPLFDFSLQTQGHSRMRR